MTATREKLSALRRSLADLEAAGRTTARAKIAPGIGFDMAGPGSLPAALALAAPGRVSLDHGALDAATNGGLLRAALHEIVAARQADAAAARGFAAAVVTRANFTTGHTIVWAEPSDVRREIGALCADGLANLGLDPARVLLVRTRSAIATLRAAVEAARCPAVAAVISEVWGTPKALDLKATRRLMLAAEASGVMVVLARFSSPPQPSAAETRWRVTARASAAAAANAPGLPAFTLTLLRHRHGIPAGPWPVEWNADDRLLHVQDLRDRAIDADQAAHAGDRAAESVDRPAAPQPARRLLRLAG